MKRQVLVLALGMAMILVASAGGESTRGAGSVLEEISRETQGLYHDIQRTTMQVRVPLSALIEGVGAGDDPLLKWRDRLDPAVRERLDQLHQDAMEEGVRAGLISPSTAPTSQPGQRQVVIIRPMGPREIRRTITQVGLVLDTQGHVLLPVYLDKAGLGGEGLRVMAAGGQPLEGTFVASDRRTGLSVVKLEKGAGRPVRLGAEAPVEGSLVLLLNAMNGSLRPVVWTGVPGEASVVFGMDGSVAGIARGGQFLSGGACGSVAKQLIEHGVVKRATLGVRVREVGHDDPVRMEVAALGDRPAMLVEQVMPGSAAAKGGVKAGDLILALGDETVGDPSSFAAAIGAREGKTPLRVLREGREVTVVVELERK